MEQHPEEQNRNEADPATPFLDSSRVAGWLGDGATLVELNGYGHTSFEQKSTCVFNIIENLFIRDARSTDRYTFCALDSDAPKPLPSESFDTLEIQGAVLSENGGSTSDPKDPDDPRNQRNSLLISVVALAVGRVILFVSLVILASPEGVDEATGGLVRSSPWGND